MNTNAQQIVRIIRGLVGVILIIAGIMNENLIGIMGVFLLITALNGGCGFGSSSCEVKPQNPYWKKNQTTDIPKIKE